MSIEPRVTRDCFSRSTEHNRFVRICGFLAKNPSLPLVPTRVDNKNMSSSDGPDFLQDTDWQTPADGIVQILQNKLLNILNASDVGDTTAFEEVLQDSIAAINHLKELDVKRTQMLEQIRQYKETEVTQKNTPHQTTPSPSQENRSSDHSLPLVPAKVDTSKNMSHQTSPSHSQVALANVMASSSEKLKQLEDDFAATKTLVRAQEVAFEPLYRQVRDINQLLGDKQREKREVEEAVGQLREEWRSASNLLRDVNAEAVSVEEGLQNKRSQLEQKAIELEQKAIQLKQKETQLDQNKRQLGQEKIASNAKAQAQRDAEARTELWAQSFISARVKFDAASRAVLDGQGKIDTLLRSLNSLQLQIDATRDAKRQSEEELFGLRNNFTALLKELEEAKSVMEIKGQAMDAPRKELETVRVVTPDMVKLLGKLQADLDAANSSRTSLKSELDTEKARLKKVRKEKDDLDRCFAVEQTRRSEAESKIQQLTVESTQGSEEIQNLRSHVKLVEAAFHRIEKDSKSVLGLWLKCRIVRCLFQSTPYATSVDEALRRNDTETERLLLGAAWEKSISQEARDQSTQDQEQALFDVFSTCASRLPDQGQVFSALLGGHEVNVCVNLLSNGEVVFVIKTKDCTFDLWHSHKSNCTMFIRRWRFWLRLGQGPQIDSIHLQMQKETSGDIVDWLEGVFEMKTPSQDELARCAIG